MKREDRLEFLQRFSSIPVQDIDNAMYAQNFNEESFTHYMATLQAIRKLL